MNNDNRILLLLREFYLQIMAKNACLSRPRRQRLVPTLPLSKEDTAKNCNSARDFYLVSLQTHLKKALIVFIL